MTHRDEYLRCPGCQEKGVLVFGPSPVDTARALCGACGREIPVYAGIPDLAEHVPLVDFRARLVQKLNNSKTFAIFYETAVWRQLLTRLGGGLSVQQEMETVLRMAGVEAARVVVDLACGTGYYARAFARRLSTAHVYGIDVSLSMLVRGRNLALREGVSKVTFVRADIYRLPFEDETANLVNCCGALHLFSDVSPLWLEISRILKPGGVFAGWALIALPRWAERKFQERLMNHGKATFFHPDQLAVDLNQVGLSAFKYVKRRAWLIFSATKRTS